MQVNSPYTEMIQLMRKHGSECNPPSIQLAEVISPPPKIAIKLGDIQLQKENLLVADYLLNDYKREYHAEGKISIAKGDKGKLSIESNNCGKTTKVTPGCVFAGQGSLTVNGHEHDIASLKVDAKEFSIETEAYFIEGKKEKFLTFTDTLKEGDMLAVMPTYDMQTYIILARVVRL